MVDIADSSGNRLLDALIRDCGALKQHLETVNYPMGHIVGSQDETLSHVYFPIGGSLLSLLVLLEGGGAAEVMVVSNEGMVGLSIWLGIKTNLSQVVLQSPGPLLRVTQRAFCHSIENSKVATTLMKRFLAYSLRSGYQTAACNANHSVEKRVSRWILATADRVGKDELLLSHSLLAHMLGVRRQSVGEVAARLQKAGLISYHRTRLRITDRAGLERHSCECYQSLRNAYSSLVGSVMTSRLGLRAKSAPRHH